MAAVPMRGHERRKNPERELEMAGRFPSFSGHPGSTGLDATDKGAADEANQSLRSKRFQ
jgi:hypothetical protein